MALSLTSLHDALAGFVTASFGTDPGSPVTFKFDKYGSVLTDLADSPPAALATEVFSELVNRIPKDAGDQVSVVMTDEGIDDFYDNTILHGASPRRSGTAEEKKSRRETFERLLAKARQDWDDQELMSVRDGADRLHRAVATPADWYASGWTHHQIEVTGEDKPRASEDQPQLWRLQLSDEALTKALDPEQVHMRIANGRRLAALRAHLGRLAPLPVVKPEAVRAAEAAPPETTGRSELPLRRVGTGTSGLAVQPMTLEAAPLRLRRTQLTAVRPAALNNVMSGLRLRDQLLVTQLVSAASETAPVTTNKIQVEFDYCLVHIERPWWMDALVSSPSWEIPDVAPASLADGAGGGEVPWLPVAVLAIRNLVITANWTGDDAAAAGAAAGLGPFSLDPGLNETGSLTHPGIQTIGWLLKPLPPLPPLAPTTTGAAPANSSAGPTTGAASTDDKENA